jgi:hypothetical protein
LLMMFPVMRPPRPDANVKPKRITATQSKIVLSSSVDIKEVLDDPFKSWRKKSSGPQDNAE